MIAALTMRALPSAPCSMSNTSWLRSSSSSAVSNRARFPALPCDGAVGGAVCAAGYRSELQNHPPAFACAVAVARAPSAAVATGTATGTQTGFLPIVGLCEFWRRLPTFAACFPRDARVSFSGSVTETQTAATSRSLSFAVSPFASSTSASLAPVSASASPPPLPPPTRRCRWIRSMRLRASTALHVRFVTLNALAGCRA